MELMVQSRHCSMRSDRRCRRSRSMRHGRRMIRSRSVSSSRSAIGSRIFSSSTMSQSKCVGTLLLDSVGTLLLDSVNSVRRNSNSSPRGDLGSRFPRVKMSVSVASSHSIRHISTSIGSHRISSRCCSSRMMVRSSRMMVRRSRSRSRQQQQH
jgi:hypothetical protein